MALIYIIEDDENIREIEELALINSGHRVFGFSSAKDFYEKMQEMPPELCLIDIMLPDESGNEIVKKLRRNPDTRDLPVIMVTARTTEMDLVRGIEDGADDYIKKPFSIMELISKVKALLRRTTPHEVKELSLDGILIDNEKHIVLIDNIPVELTYKEYELLSLLIVNKGIVLSRDVIMERVWGTYFEGESRTIDVHIKSLRQKLEKYGDRIKTVRNVGYKLE